MSNSFFSVSTACFEGTSVVSGLLPGGLEEESEEGPVWKDAEDSVCEEAWRVERAACEEGW